MKYYLLVGWLILNVPVNNFSVMLARSHRFLGITSTFREKMCLAKKILFVDRNIFTSEWNSKDAIVFIVNTQN